MKIKSKEVKATNISYSFKRFRSGDKSGENYSFSQDPWRQKETRTRLRLKNW
jgi:hypothetical protein